MKKNEFHIHFHESMALSHASFFAMNTWMEILLCKVEKVIAENLINQINFEVLRIEKLLSRFDINSEVFKINNRDNDKVSVSHELLIILNRCKNFNEKTLGYFDICVNSKSPVKSGMQDIVFLPGNELVFKNPNILLDFGAYAKGYALDKTKILLMEAGVQNALVNFGNSSVFALGRHPHGNTWKVGVQSAFQQSTPAYTFDLSDEFLTTSGVLPGKKAHIVNPLIGKIRTEHATFSVISKTAEIGEVVSTALYACEHQEIQEKLCKSFEIKECIKIFYEHLDCMIVKINNP